jgi:hypothetical protein
MKKLASEPVWKTLSASRWKTDLGGDLPEIVILVMTNDEFEKFRKSKRAAMKFVDDEKLLKRKLINLIFADVMGTKGGECWIVVLTHTTHSTAVIIAWQTC